MGKVLQPQNAFHARASGMQASNAEPGTAEALGWQLRAALPPYWNTYDPQIVRSALRRLAAAPVPTD